MKNNGKHEVCFNVQTAVDNKHKLIVDCDTTNDVNDQYICPLGYKLPFKWNGKQDGKEYRQYTCEAFNNCGQKESYTSAKGG
ncbi:MAG TPA: hypothetical protein VFK37_09080 [Bacillales bacterium]|nr:hypothetical protein [Bacillales bacterium]